MLHAYGPAKRQVWACNVPPQQSRMGRFVMVLAYVIFAAIGVWALALVVSSVRKNVQRLQGRNRCEACGSRLKAINGRYMPACRRCGRAQSWAISDSSDLR